MEENNNIDNIFKSALEDYQMDPPAGSWNALNAKLAEKRSVIRRKRWFWLFSALVFVGIVGFFGNKYFADSKKSSTTPITNSVLETNSSEFVSDNTPVNPSSTKKESASVSNPVSIPVHTENKKEDKTSSVIAAATSVNNNTADKASTTEQASVKQKIAAVNSVQSKNKLKAENPSSEKNKTEIVQVIKKTKAPVVASIVEKTKPESASVQTKEDNISKTEKNTSTSSEAKSTSLSENVSAETIVKTPVNDESIYVEKKTAEQSGSTVIPTVTVAENKSNETTAVIAKEKEAENNSSESNSKSSVANAENQAPSINAEVVAPIKTDSVSPTAELSKSFVKKILSHLSADIYYSPDYVKSRLKSNATYTGNASTNPADYASEKAKYSFSTGFNLHYDLGKNWSIGSGASYSTFEQSAVYNTINVVADSVYQEVHGHHEHSQSQGQTHTPGNQSGGHFGGQNPHHAPENGEHHFVVQTPCGAIDLYHAPDHDGRGNLRDGDTLNIKTVTSESTHFIFIPLLVKYQFGKNRLSYFIEGGGAINIVSKNTVNIVVNDSYSETNEHDGLKKINYSIMFGAGVQYRLYKGISIYLKPSIRYSVTPINQDNPLYSYPNFMGIGTGISIHF